MIPASDLPSKLPIFPLSGALLLPRSRLPLNIFEPRYLAMLDDALKTRERLIGMAQPFGADEANLHAVGCSGRITSFSETDDGRYMITLTGVSRFRISQEIEGFTPYRTAEVSWAGFHHDLGNPEKDQNFDRADFVRQLSRYFESQGLSTDWDAMRDTGNEMLINSLSMLCPFAPEDKQALLEAPTLKIRRNILSTLIEFALAGGKDENIQ